MRINFTGTETYNDITSKIDKYTYDIYDSPGNPFRVKFSEDKIKNKYLRSTINTAFNVTADVFSAFTNPYYIPHKILRIPAGYNTVVNTYKKYSEQA